jgi:stage III sporulation protein SpoIIIAA
MVAAQHRTMIEAVENHMPEVVIVVRLLLGPLLSQ